jgi:hypothetical protein
LLVAGAAPVEAQLPRPATWKVVLDHPAKDSALEYSTMPPGWHVTTGPGAFLFDPAWQVAPVGVVHAEIFLFPDSGPAEYGVFLAGDAMNDRVRRYTAVLLHRDGQVGVFRHAAGQVDTLLAWTANPAIAALSGTTDGAVKNVLRVETSAAGISVSVNGTAVATIPANSAGPGTGQAGLRVGEKMNMHISKFEVRNQ